jgi:hypothetical protein
MAIDTGKILNVKIEEYANSKCKSTSYYDLIGVHCDKADIREFAALVPNDAEVVVNYQRQMFGAGAGRAHFTDFQYYQMGVALIPKK